MTLLRLPALFLIFAICACRQPAAKHSIPTGKVHITNNGVHIDYLDEGKGDTTLLFVHGWCINKGYWHNQVKYFSNRYRVIAIDLPGYGKSGKNRSDWSTTAYGKDIKAVIDQLKLKNVVLVGHSMAGDIVLQGAIDAGNKVIGLVGVDNFKSAGVPFKGDIIKAKKEYEDAIAAMEKDFKGVVTGYFKQDLFYKTTPDSVKERILTDVRKSDAKIAVDAQRPQEFDETAKLIQSKHKLYLINSDYQQNDTSGLVAKKVPFKLLIVHDTGHFPMIEQPGEFNKALDAVMADIGENQ